MGLEALGNRQKGYLDLLLNKQIISNNGHKNATRILEEAHNISMMQPNVFFDPLELRWEDSIYIWWPNFFKILSRNVLLRVFPDNNKFYAMIGQNTTEAISDKIPSWFIDAHSKLKLPKIRYISAHKEPDEKDIDRYISYCYLYTGQSSMIYHKMDD